MHARLPKNLGIEGLSSNCTYDDLLRIYYSHTPLPQEQAAHCVEQIDAD